MVITWRTKKVEDRYEYRVFTVDYNTEAEVLHSGTTRTRARAATQAKKWVRYFKARQKAAA